MAKDSVAGESTTRGSAIPASPQSDELVAASASRAVFGIFVGGQSRRMGGTPKGLLSDAVGQTLVDRAVEACRSADPGAEILLVGSHPAYADLGFLQLADDPPNSGPVGGLRALLNHAGAHSVTIALACDLPRINAAVLERLLSAKTERAVLAPKIDALWQPLCARYWPERVLPTLEQRLTSGQRSLLGLFEELGSECEELILDADQSRDAGDCDTPEEAARHGLSAASPPRTAS